MYFAKKHPNGGWFTFTKFSNFSTIDFKAVLRALKDSVDKLYHPMGISVSNRLKMPLKWKCGGGAGRNLLIMVE